jgi:SAM-dependent methyltransferase
LYNGDLVAAERPGSYFDLFYLGVVLEHVPDSRAVLAEVSRVLRPAGYLYLRGPITTNSLARRFGLWAYDLGGREIVLREPPYHLLEFTPRSLRRLLGAAGLAVVRLSQAKIPPGHPHGTKTPLQHSMMLALDAVNLPLTRLFNVMGDRVVVVAQKR